MTPDGPAAQGGPSAGNPDIAAGDFGAWLGAMRAVLRGERDADVPCGSCVGCCVSAYRIPLRPGDVVALERVPAALLTLAVEDGRSRALMGFREDGRCPMLDGQDHCTIYADRPRTCRDYDCRVYAAAGLLPDGGRPVIAARVRAWRFSFAAPGDLQIAAAVRRAAAFIHGHADLFPAPLRASASMAAAVLALKSWELFRDGGELAGEQVAQRVQAVIAAVRAFDGRAD